MIIEKIPQIQDAFVMLGERHEDKRGWFEERFNFDKLMTKGLPIMFKQSNMSVSYEGTLRGLHLQKNNPQGKLVFATFGRIFDVMVDLREDSSTFKKWFSLPLSGTENISMYVPPGCAHGFYVQSSAAVVQYFCTTTYDKESDGGIYWADKELDITWPFDADFQPLVSAKDNGLPTMDQYLASR